MNKEQKTKLFRIIGTAVMLAALNFIPITGILRISLYMLVYLLIGYDVLAEAIESVAKRRAFDENFLMAVATVGAIALAIYKKSGDYNEAVAVMLFYQIGEFFQAYAVGKSRRSITELMGLRPDCANIERGGRQERVDPSEVEIGSVIVVNPGEKIPLDGVVIDGRCALNTSALTGESLPREVSVGDEVISGCICTDGVLKIRTTKVFGESTASKILELVENANERKSKSESFISKFARVYTPAVCFAALALAVIPPSVRALGMGLAPQFGVWLYRALTFLVISCPCALVISIPLSFFAGIGRAGKNGILIKGANYVEALSKAKCVVFDKTGTLTHGVFEVDGIHHNKAEAARLIEYAALAESASSHPISKSLQRAYGKEIDRSRVSDIREIGGKGVTATVDGVQVAAGNASLMVALNIEYAECHRSGTIVHMAIGGEYAGHIVISDVIKPRSAEAIAALKKTGVDKTVMLTGDNAKTAAHVAREINIDESFSELLPADKVGKVEELLKEKGEKSTLIFVGDGINDAPVISRADIGVAMGGIGSDAAIEAADVVIMDDDPMKVPEAIRTSKRCLAIVRQNIIFAIGIKLLCLLLGALGIASMWLAVFADVGVTVIAVANAVRILFIKKI